MRPTVLLISCYELGRQPLGIASPRAFLERADCDCEVVDLSVDALDDDAVRRADVIAVSVPMHTAMRLGLTLLPRIKRVNPEAFICYHGLYATLNAEVLFESGADSVLSGECEEVLARLVLHRERIAPRPSLDRIDYPLPNREDLPSLDRYVHLKLPDGSHRMVGTVETTRGCLHHCRHCPIPPVYGGRFFVVPKEVVLEDIRRLVECGAEHINFADPDFLNGPGHALAIVRAMRREHPELTFDFTAKVEHLLKRRHVLSELASSGCAFIVSAVESLSDRVLSELDKGHMAEDARNALAVVRRSGIAFRPTFLAFTPWTTLRDYRELFRWVLEEDLVENVDPIQMTLRLLIPPGSLLLKNPGLRPHLGDLDRAALTYRWRHPDPGMDELQRDVQAVVEESVRENRSQRDTFRQLAGRVGLADEVRAPRTSAPRLTEAWFC